MSSTRMLLAALNSSRKVPLVPFLHLSTSSPALEATPPLEKVERRINFHKEVMKKVPPTSGLVNSKPLLKFRSSNRDILSLVTKEDAKTMDHFGPAAAYMEKLRNAKYLTAARSCHDFAAGRSYLNCHLKQLKPIELLEGARLLSSAACLLQDEPEDVVLVKRMLQLLETTNSPPTLRQTIRLLLNNLMGSSSSELLKATVQEILGNKLLLHRNELIVATCCQLLKERMVDEFLTLANYSLLPAQPADISPLRLFNTPELVYWLLDAMKAVSNRPRMRLADWYFRALVHEQDPLEHVDFLNLALRVFDANYVKIEQTFVQPDGKLLPQEKTLVWTDKPVDSGPLADEFSVLMQHYAKKGGSLTTAELENFEKEVDKWKSRRKRGSALVVDSLNVMAIANMDKMIDKLAKHHANIFFVTRHSAVAALRKYSNLTENTVIYGCNRLSEDDLFSILAALKWGDDCYLLSNDRFSDHINRLSATGAAALKEWLKRRAIRLNHKQKLFWKPEPIFHEVRVLRSRPEQPPYALFIPVVVETSLLPYYTFWLVTVPKQFHKSSDS